MQKINDQNFLQIIAATPLVSIDLIVRNRDGSIFLGKRVNRPARGYWFVPGGRIRKNERLHEALERISESELGVRITFEVANLLGAYEHIYDDNFFGEKGVNTHYVVLAYEYQLDEDVQIILDHQHSEARWWNAEDLLRSSEVHDNTKAYFTNAGD